MTSHCYVYAVQALGVPAPSKIAGFHQRRLFTVTYRDLEAVVSELDQDMLQATEENVLHHEAVVEAVRQMGPAIPVRFGTLMRDRVAVASALAGRYATLVGDLDRFGDKVEMGLTVLWHEPAVEDTANQDDACQGDAGYPQSPGTRYLQAKFSQYRHDALLRNRADRLARELDSELGSLGLDRRCIVLPTRRLVMRAAYLLHSPEVEAFQVAVTALRRKRPDLRVLVTGPWPPYSFVSTTDPDGASAPGRLVDHASWELGTVVPQ